MGSAVHVRLAAASASAHSLLLDLASTLVDQPSLTHDETGRPHIPGLAVSITRTHHLIVVAATYDGPLGVDLEELRPRDFAPLANRWFTPQELAWMSTRSDELEAFLRLWAAKEAVGKALGLGLRKAGLRRQMPLSNSPRRALGEGALCADVVPGVAGLAVIQLGPEEFDTASGPAVLAIAASEGVAEVVVHQETALRSAVRPRTTLPVAARSWCLEPERQTSIFSRSSPRRTHSKSDFDGGE